MNATCVWTRGALHLAFMVAARAPRQIVREAV